MSERLDLEAIEQTWLIQCGPCDFGLVGYACNCPPGDHRAVIQRLVERVRELPEEIAKAIECADLQRALVVGESPPRTAEDAAYQRGSSDASHRDAEIARRYRSG